MEAISQQNLRNVAIIAHVDHGKTTLVDALLKQSHIFRANQQVGQLIMDSNPLERERGITILAKNTAVNYQDVKINIIDTPGHADFSGEVERVLNMADGCLLVVDAVDGPMPQTRYVLQHALRQGLTPVVVINKIDRPQSRIEAVVGLVQDLFLELATRDDQLDFPVVYASARDGYAVTDLGHPRQDMQPLFETIIRTIPAPRGDASGPLQMLVAALSYDNYLGHIAIGRVFRGVIRAGETIARLDRDGNASPYPLERVFIFRGLERLSVEEAGTGEIVALAGVDEVSIGDTITSPEQPEGLPAIAIEEPTVKMTFGVNTSPFKGREGTHATSRVLHERLMRELRTNVSLRVESTDSAHEFLVSGRGELHLAILIETMRREGYDFQVSRPEPVTRLENGRVMEPYEQVFINTSEEFIGILTENLSKRLAQLTDMRSDGSGKVHLEYQIPTRGLIGFRSFFLRATHGDGIMSALFLGYRHMEGEVKSVRSGALVSHEEGIAVTYGLLNAQGRGVTFVEPGTPVYEGMIVGMHPREDDIAINVCKEKKLTNMRSSTSDVAERLSPTVKMSLEECLDFLAEDELLEVTQNNLRLRKKVLSAGERQKHRTRSVV